MSWRVTSALTSQGYYPSQDEVWAVYKTQNPDFDPAGTAETNGPGSQADGGMDIQTLLEYLAATGGPAYAAATTALAAAYGKDVVHYGEGGSIPLVAAFLEAQPKAEMILWGAEEPQCKIHAPDESVDLGELQRCVLAEALFIAGLAETK